MTPKEKAKELVDKFYQRLPLKMDVITIRGGLSWEYDSWNEAKQCALIAVDEILNYDIKAKSEAQFVIQKRIEDYWNEVKQEIKNL